jgi:UDP-N-acetylglucosamine 2-epimerase (non-hydrolysing)
MRKSEPRAMKVLIVVGARPNFMKAAPLIAAISEHNGRLLADSANRQEPQVGTIRHILVHTGQHYDEFMSGSFFRDLNLPKPDIHLGVGSGSHAVQTAEIMKKFEEVLVEQEPDVVVVVGDVNSTLACALVTSKISFDSGGSRPVIVHVEAGLRSFDMTMPEEINRILTDHVSDLLFVTEESGFQNLRNEGISLDKIHFVGNTMIDCLLNFKEKAEASTILETLGLLSQTGKNGETKQVSRYALLTLHRASNVDNRNVLLSIVAGLEELAKDCSVVFPVHPRTQRRIREFGIDFGIDATAGNLKGNTRGTGNRREGIILTDPLGYLDFLCLMKHAAVVVTDSGGIQEETTILGTPCVTVRENTERPVTVENGTNMVAGTNTDGIKDAIRHQIGRKKKGGVPKNWDGQAAARIIDCLVRRHCEKTSFRPSLVPYPVVLADRCPCP